jgi:hypothetical protein
LTAFAWAAGVFAVGAVMSWLLLPSGAAAIERDPAAEPAH